MDTMIVDFYSSSRKDSRNHNVSRQIFSLKGSHIKSRIFLPNCPFEESLCESTAARQKPPSLPLYALPVTTSGVLLQMNEPGRSGLRTGCHYLLIWPRFRELLIWKYSARHICYFDSEYEPNLMPDSHCFLN